MPADPLQMLDTRVTDWVLLDDARVRGFAEVTGDWQFTHFDEARTQRETPFGGRIVHGFLTLSMLGAMLYEAMEDVPGLELSVNYGFDRVRFVTPVRVGARVRGRFSVADIEKGAGWANIHWDVEIEVEGQEDRPALVANWIVRVLLAAETPPKA